MERPVEGGIPGRPESRATRPRNALTPSEGKSVVNIYKISLTKDQVPFDAEARVVDFKVIPFPFRPFDQRRSPLAALPDAAADVNHCRRDQPAGCAPLAAPPVPMPPVPMPVPPLAAPPTSNVIK